MAATKWLSSSPRGLDNGSDYANAWGDINDWYAYLNASGTKGDILNIVNDGTHTAPSSPTAVTTAFAGTDYDSDPGFVMRGTDSAGVAALTTIESAASAGGRLADIRNGVAYISVMGLNYDMSTAGVDVSEIMRIRGNTAGPVRVKACRIKGYDDNDATFADDVRNIFAFNSSAPNDWGELSYCVLENVALPVDWIQSGATIKGRAHHNVIWIKNDYNGTVSNSWAFSAAAAAGNIVEFYHNTLYYDLTDTTGTIAHILKASPASGDYGTVNWHSNLMWIEIASVAATLVTSVFGGISGGSTATNIGTIGYNVIQFGPSISAGEVADIYEPPWDDGEDPKSTDNVAYEVADTVPFLDPSTTFLWDDVDSTGYDLTVPADLRPIIHRTAGESSSIPGALPSGETDYTVTITSDSLNPEPEDNVQLTIIIANSGTSATSVEVTAAIPAGLAYISHSPTAGTYVSGTGLWTLPTLADAASETLVINVQVDADQAGNSIDFTATQTDGSPSIDPVPGDNTDTVTLSIVDAGDPGDPGGDGAIPFLDVFPIFTDVWTIDINSWMKTSKNRIQQHALRSNREERLIREISLRRISLAPSTTIELNIGGIKTGHYLMVDSTEVVAISVGQGSTDDNYLPDATFLFIGGGTFERIAIQNNSSTDTAEIIIGVTD